MRNTLFISHATPEDNDFAIWLASRLQSLGYDVWIDKTALVGGEKTWEIIDDVLRNKAIKYLLVYSKDIFLKDESQLPIPGRLKDGVSKEWSFAETIAKQDGMNEFIILLNIDHSSYNLFIGADRLNQISFSDNWASGFQQLTQKLRKDNVPTVQKEGLGDFSEWYENQFFHSKGIYAKRERYYSSWWAINELPKYFYIYQFENKQDADLVWHQYNEFPRAQTSNCIAIFEEKDSFNIIENGTTVELTPTIFPIRIADIFVGITSEIFPSQRDAENHLKSLLKSVFHQLMKNRGLFWYSMANKRLAYFYTRRNLPSLKVEFPYRTRKRRFKIKQLIGKYKDMGNWHFAVSVQPRLTPTLCFSLKNHLTFTSDGLKVWKNKAGDIDKDKLHSHRRAKGKMIFNHGWRDLFLGFIHGLKKNGKIEVALSPGFTLEMPSDPITYETNFGYDDPKDINREGLLVVEHFDDDDINNSD